MTRVLVVDDSEDLQDALRMVLTDEGFDVASALDGRSGLELTRRLRPDAILLDMMMPEMDGLQFLSHLSAEPAPPPVVATSGFDCFRAEALRRGAVAFLVKPMSTDVLVAALRSALERQPVGVDVVAANVAAVERTRREALDGTARAVAQLDREPPADLREGLRRVVRWLPTYLGFGMSLVHVLRGVEVCIEAIQGEPAEAHEGMRYPRAMAYCDDVIAAGSTLVLTDPLHHPCAHFSEHVEVEQGWRFYAGVPLTTPGGAVLGTLCVGDKQPHEFRGEDMRVLEALGLAVARAMGTGEWPLDEHGTFSEEHRDLFVDVAVARAMRPGGAGLAMLLERCDPPPAAMGLAAVRTGGALALIWGGAAGAWTLPQALVPRVRAQVDLSGMKDRDEAGRRLRSVLACEAARV